MAVPIDVMAFYAALVVWLGLLARGFQRRRFGAFLVFGVVLLVVLNGRYAVDGAARSAPASASPRLSGKTRPAAFR